MTGLNVNYPEIVWPKTPPAPGAAPLINPQDVPESYKQLQADGEPQNPVTGVPPQLVPPDDDALEEPGVPAYEPDPAGGKPTLKQVPDDRKSVTGETVKTEATGWMKELNHFGDLSEIGTSFKRGALQAVPDFIMGVNAEVQGLRIANSVGLGEMQMQNFKAYEPTLRIALGNPDDVSREASRQRILATVDQTMPNATQIEKTSARDFINAAFDKPKFLDEMTERSKFRYNVFTDPVMQAAFEMQENIKNNNPQDMKFVGSWADMLASGAGSMASAIAARKTGGEVGGAAFLAYQGGGQEFDKALKAGADPEIAFKAASMGRFIGITDVLPIERLVKSPKVTKALFALAVSAGKQAMIEGAQEGFQQYMSNVLAKTLYKPDQSVSQDVWENVVLGAVLGAGADLATGGFREELAKTPEQLTEDTLSQSAPFQGPAADEFPPKPSEKPVQPASPEGTPIAPATGEAPVPASPTATKVAFAPPAPMKVGDISKLPPAARAVEADYVMAHDFNLVEPIQQEIAAGTPVESIADKVAPLLTPVTEYLARRGVTDPAEVKVELDGFVRSVIAKLAPEGSPQAPARALAGSEVSGSIAPGSPAFRNWFEGSQIVDDAGEPMVMFHGTGADFKVFDTDKNQSGAFGAGIYATNDESLGRRYSGDKPPMKLFVKMKNPYIMDSSLPFEEKLARGRVFRQKGARERLMAQGYDGVLLKEGNYREAIAFENTQVKSADKNDGTYDAADPDITSSVAPDASSSARSGLGLELQSDIELLDQATKDGRVAEIENEAGLKVLKVLDKYYLDTTTWSDEPNPKVWEHATFSPTEYLRNNAVSSSVAPDQTQPSARAYETVTLQTTDEQLDAMFPLAGEEVGGLKVRSGTIPNQSSIGASIDNSETLKGVREVFIDGFEDNLPPTNPDKRTKDLAAEIKASGEIMPLIVAIDSQGAYILEGGHRFDALKLNGVKSFPALVVLDIDSLPNGDVTAAKAPPDQTESGRFKAWFGDSKVVGPDGKPLVVYHATDADADFSAFKVPAYFASTSADAETFDRGEGDPRIIPVYLSIQNPAIVTEFESIAEMETSDIEAFKADGHDGVILKRPDGTMDIFAVFDPSQIKSAVGNDGSFDASDPDITSSVAPEPKQTETPEFKNWFQESKVVDESGKPLVVYHGTNQDFAAFSRDRIGQNTTAASSTEFFFTEDPREAGEYATLAARHQVKDAVSVETKSAELQAKMARAEKAKNWDLVEQLTLELEDLELGAINAEDAGHQIYPTYLSIQNPRVVDMGGRFDGHVVAAEIAAAKEAGQDGLQLLNVFDAVAERPEAFTTNQWVAFEPTQIKSAIGNSGAFDPANPDITASTSPLKPKGARHAYIHERIRPSKGIAHQVMVNGQSVVDIAKKFKDALGLTVQQGRFDRGHSKAEGIFKWGQSVARVKNESDLTTLFHEGAHHLHQMMGKPLDAIIDKNIKELKHIALHYYGGGGAIDASDKRLVRAEGFAHFFQVFVNNPLEAGNIAPGFEADFADLLDKQYPGLRDALSDVIKAVDVQITQKSSMQIALEHVSPGTKPGTIGRIVQAAKGGNLMHEIGTLINRAYMSVVGSEFALQHTVHALAAIAESNYRVLVERGEMSMAQAQIAINKLSKVGKADPTKMYWAAKNSAMRSAEFLHSGVQKFNTTDYKAVSKGFAEIMANVVGSARGHLHEETVHAFDAYLMARRIRSERQNYDATMAWLRSGKNGAPPPVLRMQDPDSSFSKGDTNQAIADFEKQYPRFKQSADDVYGFLRAMIEYRRDAGDFSKEEADYLLGFEDYVPVHRVIEDLKRLSGAGQGVDGKSNGIKQFKGSGRQIVSPLRSIWQMTHQQLSVSMQNEMKLSLVNMALDIGQGTGALIERIPDTKMTGTTVNLSELLKAAGHVDVSSVTDGDIQDLADLADEILTGEETATIWRSGDINENGEHIIYVRRNGKREAYKLNDPAWADDLYRTLTDLAPPQRTMLIHILSAPARALRWGVVTEPIYQLANIIRDGFTTMVLQPGSLPFQVVGKGLKNHLYRSEMQKLYNLSGTTIAGRGIEALDKRKFGIEQSFLASHGISLKDVPLASGIGEVVKTFYSSEALGRQGLFARSYERAIKDGLAPHDALVEAGYTTSDYANYGRGGSRMAELRAIIPFLGAGIQGLDKFGRAAFAGTALPAAMRKKLVPYMNRMLNLEGSKTSLPLSQAEAESFKYAAKVQAAMLVLGVASMLLDSAYWGDEEYEQMSPYLRGTRWLIKIGPGQWLGIPKPFQYSFYSTLFSYGLDAAYKGDTTAMMKFLESQLYVTALPYENPGIALGYELAFNKDLFTGRDIVPQNLAARPWRMQSDIYTSVLGKQLGQLTGLSPMVIDHVITSSFATWGRSAISLSNLTDTTKPEQGLEDYAFTRYFVKNGSRSTTVKPAFWNLVGQSTGNLVGAYGAYRDLMNSGATGQAQQYLSGATDDERVYAMLNFHQKPEAKKLHPLRNANDMVTALSAMRKEITANNFKLDGGEGERVTLSPTIQRQLNDRLSALGIREMRNALVLTDQPGFGGKRILPTLSIYKEIEAIDGRVARELKNRLGSKVYSFDKLRQMWPQVRTEILLNGENAKLTPFVSQARAGGRNYFTDGDAAQ